MKSFVTFLAVAAIFLASAGVQNAHAQLEFSVGGGVNSPLGEFGDQANTGYAITAGLGYRVMPMLSLGAEFGYNGSNAPDEFTQAVGPDIDMSISILQYSGVAKLIYPVGRTSLFAKGSVGNYRGSATVTTPLGQVSANNTDLGFGFGGGLMISGAKNSAFFLDITHHHIAYDGADFDTNFLTFNVGAVFTFDLFNKQNLEDKHREELEALKD